MLIFDLFKVTSQTNGLNQLVNKNKDSNSYLIVFSVLMTLR
jgi:hypothetical protein